MFRLLILLGAMMYGVLLIAGEDKGQMRAGLRDVPDAAAPAAPVPAAPVMAEAPADAVAPAAAAVTLASLPHQPIRVLPAPPRPVAAALSDLPTGSIAPADPAETAESDVQDDLPANTQLRWVTVDSANVRKAPSRNSSVTGRVEQGEALLVLWTEDNGWARIRVEGDGVDGFVHESLLTDTDPAQ